MSNPEDLKNIKSVADAYTKIINAEREKAVEEAQKAEEPAPAPEEKLDEDADVRIGAAQSSTGAPAFKVKNNGREDVRTAMRHGHKMRQKASEETEEDEDKKTKKKGAVTINPELAEDGHTDVSSAMRKCKTIIEDAQEILIQLQQMSPEDGLPSWWMNAVAVSAHELNSMRDYIKNPKQDKE